MSFDFWPASLFSFFLFTHTLHYITVMARDEERGNWTDRQTERKTDRGRKQDENGWRGEEKLSDYER